VSSRSISSEHQLVWEDCEFLSAVVSIDLQDTLNDARSGDFNLDSLDKYEDVNRRYQALLSAALQHFMVEGGSEKEAYYLSAAFTAQEAIQEAIDGVRTQNVVFMEEAECRIGESFEVFLTTSRRPGD
jgi:hypothetical protein